MGYLGNQPAAGENNSFKILDDISSYTLTFDGSSSSVVSTSDNTITEIAHRFITGQRVTYTNGSGTDIGGLTDGNPYYIIKNDQNTIKLAASASDANNNVAISLSAVGTGSDHTLNVAFDNVNTKFKATYDNGTKAKMTRAAQLTISINGVIQQPQDSATPTAGFGFDLDSVIVLSVAPSPTDIFWGHLVANNFPTFDISDNTVDSFIGDNSTTDFTLSKTPANNQNVLVTLDGVVQYPSDATTTRAYSVSENVISFASAPSLGVEIQVRHIGFAGATSSAVTGFYGRTGNVILTSGDDIVVNDIVAVGASFSGSVSIGGTLTYEDVTNVDAVGLITARSGIHVIGTGSTVGIGTAVPEYPLHVKSVGTGGTSLYIVGQSQLNRVAITTSSSSITLEAGRTYVYYSSVTLTLPASPTVGDRLEIINRSGTITGVLARNGSNIMGVADDLDLDILDAAFKVTYSNASDGWVVGT